MPLSAYAVLIHNNNTQVAAIALDHVPRAMGGTVIKRTWYTHNHWNSGGRVCVPSHVKQGTQQHNKREQRCMQEENHRPSVHWMHTHVQMGWAESLTSALYVQYMQSQ